MSSRSLSRCSISKQRGAEMSSRLMPPKLGREPGDRLDDLVGVLGVQADRHGVDAAELLEQHRLALHHGHRGGRADVAEPEHRGAVGDDRDGVGDPGVVVDQGRAPRRSPRTPAPRPACRPSRGRRGRSRATVDAISILPPRCRSKTGSPARDAAASGGSGVWDIEPMLTVCRRPAPAPSHQWPERAPAPPPPRPASGIAPTSHESTPSAGLSRSTHQPPSRRAGGAASRRAPRPAGVRRPGRPSRGTAPCRTSSRSPSYNVGCMDRPRTTARPHVASQARMPRNGMGTHHPICRRRPAARPGSRLAARSSVAGGVITT